MFSSDPGQLKELMSILNAADDNCPREKVSKESPLTLTVPEVNVQYSGPLWFELHMYILCAV